VGVPTGGKVGLGGMVGDEGALRVGEMDGVVDTVVGVDGANG